MRTDAEMTGMGDDFDHLFLTEYPRVLTIAQRVLRNRPEAEQVAKQVLVEFRRRHPILPGDSAARLHRAAVDAALESARASDGERGAASDGERGATDTQDPQALREALGRLPRSGAAVLALRASRLTYAETAAVLGVGVEQVAAMLRRAEVLLLREMGG